MVRLVSKVSKGTRMDQIYLPKKRVRGLETGTYVVIEPVLEKTKITPYFYNLDHLEPIKINIVQEIFHYLDNAENVIFAGSFLEKGFSFQDIDIIIINGQSKGLKSFVKEQFGISIHIINTTYETLRKGFNTDPLFQMLLSKFISKKRILLKKEPKINYKLFDLHLLKSKTIIDNFDFLTGQEKYKLLRNIFAIKRFLENKKISKEKVELDIDKLFGKGTVQEVFENTIQKKDFLRKFKRLYNDLFNKIMKGIKNGAK